jgi:hypothetical protein
MNPLQRKMEPIVFRFSCVEKILIHIHDVFSHAGLSGVRDTRVSDYYAVPVAFEILYRAGCFSPCRNVCVHLIALDV